MSVPANRLKAALAGGEVQTGLWLALASPLVAEIAGRAGFDWCLVDGEHGPNAVPTMLPQLQALEAAGCAAVVRVPVNEAWVVKQVLDLGAQSVLVPMVDTPEQAAAAVAACRYPPEGIRGVGAALARASRWGAVPGYVGGANAEICVMVQVESARAVGNVAAIADTEGVDVVFVGPADLAADMGHPGAPDHPEVRAAIEAAVATIRASGKAAGIVTFDADEVAVWARLGVTFLGVGGDADAMTRALTGLAAQARAATGGA